MATAGPLSLSLFLSLTCIALSFPSFFSLTLTVPHIIVIALKSRCHSYHDVTHIIPLKSRCHPYHDVIHTMTSCISRGSYHDVAHITISLIHCHYVICMAPHRSLISRCHSYHNVTRTALRLTPRPRRGPLLRALPCVCMSHRHSRAPAAPASLSLSLSLSLCICINDDVTAREVTSRIILMFVVVVVVVVDGTSPEGRYSETLNGVCVSLRGVV